MHLEQYIWSVKQKTASTQKAAFMTTNTFLFKWQHKKNTFSELDSLPVSQVQREQRLRIQTCYRLCVWRTFRVSRSIRSRSRHSASAIVLCAPLLFSQWDGSLLSCSFVRRTSCFWTESAQIKSHIWAFSPFYMYLLIRQLGQVNMILMWYDIL